MSDDVDQFCFGAARIIVVGTLRSASAHLLPIACNKERARSVSVTVREGPMVQHSSSPATGELDLVVGAQHAPGNGADQSLNDLGEDLFRNMDPLAIPHSHT
jgi:hypothetical protein